MNYIIKNFSTQVDISGFDCGVTYLNDWIRQYAGQTERKSEARSYLALDPTSNQIAGFYSLLVTEVNGGSSNLGKVRRLPAVLVANLAVDVKFQRRGLGSLLVVDAIAKSLSAADLVGISIILVDPFDSGLVSFYERFGFMLCDNDDTVYQNETADVFGEEVAMVRYPK